MSDKNVSLSVVRAIVDDIYSRYGLEQEFRSTHPKVLVSMYETWIEIVSKELYNAGLIDEVYKPLEVKEMHLVDIVNRIPFYLQDNELDK